MLLQRAYRWRLVMTLFLLVFFGIAEYAESGLFRRCRLRMRRCRPVVCQPKYSPQEYSPQEYSPQALKSALESCPAGYICPYDIIAEYYVDEECAYTSYYAYRCPSEQVHYDALCDLPIPASCNACEDCYNGPVILPNPIPVPPDIPEDENAESKTSIDARRYVSDGLAKCGIAANGRLRAGAAYSAEQWDDKGAMKQGVVVKMQLRDKGGAPIDVSKNVHLDWFRPRGITKRDNHGVGYETTDAIYGPAVIENSVRLLDRIYSLRVNYKGQIRHYMVYLP